VDGRGELILDPIAIWFVATVNGKVPDRRNNAQALARRGYFEFATLPSPEGSLAINYSSSGKWVQSSKVDITPLDYDITVFLERGSKLAGKVLLEGTGYQSRHIYVRATHRTMTPVVSTQQRWLRGTSSQDNGEFSIGAIPSGIIDLEVVLMSMDVVLATVSGIAVPGVEPVTDPRVQAISIPAARKFTINLRSVAGDVISSALIRTSTNDCFYLLPPTDPESSGEAIGSLTIVVGPDALDVAILAPGYLPLHFVLTESCTLHLTKAPQFFLELQLPRECLEPQFDGAPNGMFKVRLIPEGAELRMASRPEHSHETPVLITSTTEVTSSSHTVLLDTLGEGRYTVTGVLLGLFGEGRWAISKRPSTKLGVVQVPKGGGKARIEVSSELWDTTRMAPSICAAPVIMFFT
jgi:hypothetical protein